MAEEEKVIQDTENAGTDVKDGTEQNAQEDNIMDNDEKDKEIEALKKELESKEKELSGYIDLAQRIKAEFENYKKRTMKEKDQLYTDITGDIVFKLLPVIDNLERAASSDTTDAGSISEGLKMILKQFKDILGKEGVQEIEAMGKEFDPNYHDAVMHVEDESQGAGVIVEVFQKGYKIKDKVIRHSMVKVAN